MDKSFFKNFLTTCSTKDVLMKYQDICSENKPWVVTKTDEKSFVFKSLEQKLPFYFLGNADSGCKIKFPYNKNG